MPIQLLSPMVAAQIAAGEVVERPASIAKELIENALDAGARTITVALRGGGLRELRVQDDGSGIGADEVELAFERHATSKLRSADDLWALTTLGFRGEALPSIAAVAQVICTTRTADEPMGTELRIAGGEVQARTPTGAPRGTTFSIRNLFYNVPVRREFLKSEATEASAVTTIVTQYALGYPDVRFTLLRDERVLFQTSGDGDLRAVALAIYGVELARQMREVQADSPAIAVSGLISPPALTRSSRDGMHLFVNRRAIQPRGPLVATIMEAYHTALMKGRFPCVVLNLQVHPGLVDVNIHPTKSEVKFRGQDASSIERLLGSAVRTALQGTEAVLPWRAPSEVPAPEADVTRDPLAPPPVTLAAAPERPANLAQQRLSLPPAEAPPMLRESAAPAYDASPASPHAASAPVSAGPPFSNSQPLDPQPSAPSARLGREPRAEPPTPPSATRDRDAQSAPVSDVAPPPTPSEQPAEHAPPQVAPDLATLRPLAQLGLAYLLAEGPSHDLYLVDQHAAHERITYERLMAQRGSGTIEAQTLLAPLPVALPPAARETLLDAADDLAAWGFQLAETDGELLVHAIPALLAVGELSQALLEVADHLRGSGGATPHARREAMLTTLACHTSVRFGQTLSTREQQALLDQLGACAFPRTCPHGRPTVLVMTTQQIARQFGRLQ